MLLFLKRFVRFPAGLPLRCTLSCCVRGPVIRAAAQQSQVRWSSADGESHCKWLWFRHNGGDYRSSLFMPSFQPSPPQIFWSFSFYAQPLSFSFHPAFCSHTVPCSTWISETQKALLTREGENIGVRLFSKTRSSRVNCMGPFHWKYFSRNRWCRWLMQWFEFYF